MEKKNDILFLGKDLDSIDTMNVESVISACTSGALSAGEVFRGLTRIVDCAKEQISVAQNDKTVDKVLESTEKIAGGLRRHTRKHEALQYFYYGIFQAQIDEMKERLAEEREQNDLLAVTGRKWFQPVMRYLYQGEYARLTEMSRDLVIDPSNLFRELSRMIAVGLVNQRKFGNSSYYNLAPRGFRYYEEHIQFISLPERKQRASEREYFVSMDEARRVYDKRARGSIVEIEDYEECDEPHVESDMRYQEFYETYEQNGRKSRGAISDIKFAFSMKHPEEQKVFVAFIPMNARKETEEDE